MKEERIKEIVRKLDLELAVRNGKEGIKMEKKHLNKKNENMIEEMKTHRDEFIAYFKKQEEKKAAQKKAEEEARAEERRQLLNSEKKISAKWEDGEYLQAYIVFGEEAKVLEEAGVAHWVSGWGYKIENAVVETLGEEFTYAELMEYLAPKKAEEAKKEEIDVAKRNSAIEQAKVLGEPVEIGRYTVDCDGSVAECSTDILIQYIDGKGNITTKRVHTY